MTSHIVSNLAEVNLFYPQMAPCDPLADKVSEAVTFAAKNFINLVEDEEEDEKGAGEVKDKKAAKKAKKQKAKTDSAVTSIATEKLSKEEKKKAKKAEKASQKTDDKIEVKTEKKKDKKAKKSKDKPEVREKEKKDKKDKLEITVHNRSEDSVTEATASLVEPIAQAAIQEVVKTKKAKAGREEFGIKHYSWLVAGAAFTTGMAILFKENPFIAASAFGAWVDFVRVAYKGLPREGWQITAWRAAAAALVVIQIIAAVTTDKDSAFRAIPWLAIPMAVFIKGELNKLEPATLLEVQKFGLGERLQSLGLTANHLEVGVASSFAISSAFCTWPTLPFMVQAAGATVLKANLRKMVNKWLSSIHVSQEGTSKKVKTIATFMIFAVVGGLSYAALEKKLLTNSAAIMAMTAANIVPFDTAARIAKNFLWNLSDKLNTPCTVREDINEAELIEMGVQNPHLTLTEAEGGPKWSPLEIEVKKKKEKEAHLTLVEKFLDVAQHAPMSFMLMAMIYGVSIPLDQYFLSNNLPLGLKIVVAQELATLFKPISKGWVGTTASVAIELPAIAIMSLGLVNSDFALAITADNLVFNLKSNVRPAKLEKKKVEELPV